MSNPPKDPELLLHVADMDREFNHAANASPRSGSSKRGTPVVWCVIVVAMVVVALWFRMHP
jgi:hypothetical protein